MRLISRLRQRLHARGDRLSLWDRLSSRSRGLPAGPRIPSRSPSERDSRPSTQGRDRLESRSHKEEQSHKEGRYRRIARWTAILAALALVTFAVAWFAFPFPIERLDNWPVSPRVTDRTDRVLLTLVAKDEQWRFPIPLTQMSPWLVKATIAAEDERFFFHPGVDPISVVRAVGQNIAACGIQSGASTLTMQICRMMDDRPRSFRAKIAESFRALQLERLRSKDDILEAYLNLAPYGRNFRGVQAASLAWFGRPASELTLSEAALLAGLPQSPARYRPDRHPDRAKARRNVVLYRMLETGVITHAQWQQAVAEPVILRPAPRQIHAPQAAWLALHRRPLGGRTTIHATLQNNVERLAKAHAAALPPGTNVAVLLMDISTGDILALVGSADPADPIDGQVNGVIARRSPGSTLKPFVYAAAFQARRLAPDSTVYDIPIDRAGWSPENFDRSFCGPLPAAEALQRSLNVPAILTAEAVGLARCAGLIESAGVRLPDNVLARGGLAVVTGATEVTLLDLVTGYATIGRGGLRQAPRLFMDDPTNPARALEPDVCAALDDILSSEHRRPKGMESWPAETIPWFMWKTGTSSRRRDAWAVGHNHRVAVGVWVGRFSGAGHAGYVGAHAAEPLLSAIFDLPAIRSSMVPDPPRLWAVLDPLPRPAELGGPLQILTPRNGARFVALGGQTVIRPRANRDAGLTWFLNGRLLPPDQANRLTLPPGQFELRCTTPAGPATATRFTILPE